MLGVDTLILNINPGPFILEVIVTFGEQGDGLVQFGDSTIISSGRRTAPTLILDDISQESRLTRPESRRILIVNAQKGYYVCYGHRDESMIGLRHEENMGCVTL